MTSTAPHRPAQRPIAPPRRIRRRLRVRPPVTVPPPSAAFVQHLRDAADSTLRTAGVIAALLLVDVLLTVTRPLGALLLAASTGAH